jgi:hypothetical protein
MCDICLLENVVLGRKPMAKRSTPTQPGNAAQPERRTRQSTRARRPRAQPDRVDETLAGAVPAAPIVRAAVPANVFAGNGATHDEHADDMPASPVETVSMVSEPSEEDIRMRAYQRFLERGASHGADFDDWLTAERELRKRG